MRSRSAREPGPFAPGRACAFALLMLALAAWSAARPSSSRWPMTAAHAASSAGALAEAYRYDGLLAGTPSRGLPDEPRGLDVADDGLIYVAEQGGRVSVWHQDGGTDPDLATRGDGPGAVVAPEDVAVSADGKRVYVADPLASRVQVYDRRSGGHLASWDDVGTPRGVAAGADGRVYVSDAGGHRIHVRDPEGRMVATWGGPGTAPGRFDTPLGLAVAADGSVLVADSGNQRVQRLAADGAAESAIDLSNAGGPGGVPYDVASSGDTVYVAVDRAVLRYRGATFVGALPPLEPAPPSDCPLPDPCRCREVQPVADNHEGVQRVAASERLGVFFTYAPQLRAFDRIVALPARGFPSVIPWRCSPFTAPALSRPMRISTGDGRAEPVVLGRARALWRASASGNGIRAPLDPADDVAVTAGGATLVVSGNQVASTAGVTMTVLDPDMMTRRNRANDRVPDAGWWHTALAAHDGPNGRIVAVLDAGRQRATLRRFPDGLLVGQLAPSGAREPFRALADVAFDARGWLWIVARDGTLWRYDASGRLVDRLLLAEAGREGIVALAVDEPLDAYALTARGTVWKHRGADGATRARWDAASMAVPPGGAIDLTDIAVDAAGAVLLVDPVNEAVHRFVPTAPDDDPAPAGSACGVAVDKRAAPDRVRLGDAVSVTLTIGGTCAGGGEGLDAVLVVDGGCQLAGRRLAAARAAGARLAADLRPGRDRLAIVRFTDEEGGARLLAPLSDDQEALGAVARGLRNECLPPELVPGRGFEGRLSDGLRAGFEALYGPAARVGAARAAIVVSPSRFDTAATFARLAGLDTPFVLDRTHALWQARRLGALGARVFTVSLPEEARAGFPLAASALGRQGLARAALAQPGEPEPTPAPDPRAPHPSDDALLASLALPPSGFRVALDADDLPEILAAIAEDLAPRPLFAPLVVTDVLPANMRLVAGSAQPPAELLPGGVLRWRLDAVPLGAATTLRYRVTPLDAGLHPTNVEAIAAYTDGLGAGGRMRFPVPTVAVIAPEPSATASTEPSASPPPTASPDATRTPGPTSTVALSPTARASRTPTLRAALYLPRVVRDACQPKQRPVDVALLIDTSSSMNGAKIASARASARTFLGLLDLPRDQATVVRFDHTAVLVEPLTGERARLEAALDRLTTAVGTRLDLGLWAAIGAVRERGRSRGDADPVIVLLTDGRTEGGSEGAALQAARLARDVGIRVFAIGLGFDAAPDFLSDVAGGTEHVYLAPSPADLARVYAQIARAIPCR